MVKVEALKQIVAGQLQQEKSASQSKPDTAKFSETLGNMMEQVNELQNASGAAIEDFVAGKDIQLHEVMAIGEEAQISFQFLLEVRNKLIESYQELSRMPV